MPDPQPNPEVTPTPQPDPEPTPASPKSIPEPPPEPTLLEKSKPVMVNPDGTFSDDWVGMLPEDLKADAEGLKQYKDVSNLVKATINARKAVGKKGVTLPDEKSTPEEVDAFYQQLGMPEKAEDYKFDVPEDFQEIFTPEMMQRRRERARKYHATQEMFEAFMQDEIEDALALLKQADEEDAAAKQSVEQALRQEFGGSYEERMHVANRLVTEAFPNEEQRMEFLQEYGNDPKIIRFASVLGARLSESKAVVAQLTQDTPKEARKKITDLMNTPGYLGPYRDNEGRMVEMPDDQRKAIVEQIREYEKQIFPEATKRNAFVGSG